MNTHRIINTNGNNMNFIPDKSVNLIVTSPPYPMIEMWDKMFFEQDKRIENAFECSNYDCAFNLMHELLNQVWIECDRVLSDNGFICINIGDATRTFSDNFQLFSNHTKIIEFFTNIGYYALPDILWRKQSNSPNKFMGSGMYPAGAYVTYEHEYILIFRKGGKRTFDNNKRLLRQKSAYFWEERNIWFSDLWDIKGISQKISKTNSSRNRSASFPLEIPFRLVNMYSIKGDTILDPFCGFGTTNIACMLSQRNSIGIEIDKAIYDEAILNLNIKKEDLNNIIHKRLNSHIDFIESLPLDSINKCYRNNIHGFLVKTQQEKNIEIQTIAKILIDNNIFTCIYE